MPSVGRVASRAPLRLTISIAAGVAVALVLRGARVPLQVVSAWNAIAFVMLSFAWWVIWRSDAEETRCRAAADDPGRSAVWVVALLSSTISLFAAIFVLRQARALAPEQATRWVLLCLLAVVLSWLLTHTSWALRYAHLYYRDDAEGIGGLTFPGDAPPDAFDFAYFAFTIGICFQVSDVVVSSRQIRRSVLFHACQSFAYTTAIMALSLNLAFGFVT